ncbi:MAG: hypothetical protein HZA50_02155 [Planctomycetes bacterium]|nr:hypothetical protein [Planctomycetota bacterium]
MTDNKIQIGFAQTAELFNRLLHTAPWGRIPALQPSAPTMGLVITPWCSCPIPWYGMAIGLMLRLRGVNTVFVRHDLCDYPAQDTFEQESRLVGEILGGLKGIPIVQLSKQPPAALDEADRNDIDEMAYANALWWNHGTIPEDKFGQIKQYFTGMFAGLAQQIKGLYRNVRMDRIIIPGGTFGSSGLYYNGGVRSSVRVITYDSGYGGIYIGVRDKAANLGDTAECMKLADSYLSSHERELAAEAGREIFESRMEKKDSYLYSPSDMQQQSIQTKAFSNDSARYEYDVVMPLNVEWDTGVLGMHRFFENNRQWASQTIRHILEKTSASVVVRQHPGERTYNTGVPLEKDIKRQFGGNKRFRFITCDEEINTYKLISGAKVVLPFTSTVGLEAAIMNVPVVVESRVYYGNQSFVKTAGSKEDYFRLIEEAAAQPRTEREGYNRQALLCYFLAMRASCLAGSFTPHPPRCTDWLQWDFERLMKYPETETMIRSIMEDKPVAMIQSGRILKGEGETVANQESLSARPPESPAPACPLPQGQAAGLFVRKSISQFGEPFALFPGAAFGKDVQVLGVSNIEIGQGTCLGDEAWLNICIRDDKIRLRIGAGVLIGRQNMISTAGFMEIGDFCLFGPRVSIIDADHTFGDIYLPYTVQPATANRQLIVEENCWIGVGAAVVGSLTVGRGSIIGANAVVLCDVPPFSVAVGNPARVVKMFNPAANQWQKVAGAEQQEEIVAARMKAGMPPREQYRQILRSRVAVGGMTPLLAGRGCL